VLIVSSVMTAIVGGGSSGDSPSIIFYIALAFLQFVAGVRLMGGSGGPKSPS
jgi:hypothetical protein